MKSPDGIVECQAFPCRAAIHQFFLSRIPFLPCQCDLVEPRQDREQWMPLIHVFRLPHETDRAARRIDSPHAGTHMNNSIRPGGDIASRHPRAALQLPPHVFHPRPAGNEAIGFEIQQEFVAPLPAIVDRQVDSRTMVMIMTGVMVPPEHGIASQWVSDDDRAGIRVQPRPFSRVAIVIAVVVDDEYLSPGK